MKTLFKIILVSALILGTAGEARANFRDGQQVPAEIIRPLMNWVENADRYPCSSLTSC